MTFRQTVFMLLLTAAYLVFELAFNARLLDVVGGGANPDQIHNIEYFGRSLSGIALALVMLQVLLTLKNSGTTRKSKQDKVATESPAGGKLCSVLHPIGVVLGCVFAGFTVFGLPFFAASTKLAIDMSAAAAALSGMAILGFAYRLWSRPNGGAMTNIGISLVCLFFAGCVFFSLERLTDYLTDSSAASFRHASQNIVLVQKALVDGKVRIDGLSEDPEIFAKPEGKAFLALFPLMAVSVERLDEKIRSAKLDLIREQISDKLGGPQGVYIKYREGVKSAAEQWKRYDAAGNGGGGGMDIETRQRQAWDDYTRSLSKQGWTPYTVPEKYRGKVLRKVQAKVPVPNDWDLADESVFNEAVAKKVEAKSGSRGNGLNYKGKQIPFGLSWPEFFAHPAVQSEMRSRMGLPSQAVLLPGYPNGGEFERKVFEPMVDKQARKQLEMFDAPIDDFADDGKFEEEGRSMARAAIVPPLALFFSLLGALGHLGKFSYLFMKTAFWRILPKHKNLGCALLVGVVLVIPAAGLVLRNMDNAVTQSRLYQYLQGQVGAGDSLGGKVIVTGAHIVAVGQGKFYPFDEWLRVNVLSGFSFGYRQTGYKTN